MTLWLVHALPGAAAGEQSPRPGDELLMQHLNIDQEGLRAKGRVVVRSLSPPHGEVILEQASGEGPRLVKLLSRWIKLPAELSRDFPIRNLTLRDARMVYQAGAWRFTAAEAIIPEGAAHELAFSQTADGQWQGSVAGFHFDPLPPWPGLPPLGKVSGEKLAGNGDGQSLRLQVKSWRGGGLALDDGQGAATPPREGRVPWSWQARKAVLDLASAWSWAKTLPPLQQVSTIAPEGQLILGASDFKGEYEPLRQQLSGLKGKGALTLRQGAVTLHPAGMEPEKIRIETFTAEGRGDGDTLLLDGVRLQLKSGSGSGEVRGLLSWPLRLEKNRLTVQAHDLRWAGWRLTGQGGWRGDGPTPLALDLTAADGSTLVLDGQMGPWVTKKTTGLDMQLTRLETRGTVAATEQPFFHGAVPMPLVPVRLKAKKVVLGSLATLTALEARHPLDPPPATAKSGWGASLSGRWCEGEWQGSLWVTADGAVALQASGRQKPLLLSQWVACGLAPAYRVQDVDGRIQGQWRLTTAGSTLAHWQRRWQGEATLTVQNGTLQSQPRPAAFSWLSPLLERAGVADATLFPFDTLKLTLAREGEKLRVKHLELASAALLARGQGEITHQGGEAALTMDMELSPTPGESFTARAAQPLVVR